MKRSVRVLLEICKQTSQSQIFHTRWILMSVQHCSVFQTHAHRLHVRVPLWSTCLGSPHSSGSSHSCWLCRCECGGLFVSLPWTGCWSRMNPAFALRWMGSALWEQMSSGKRWMDGWTSIVWLQTFFSALLISIHPFKLHLLWKHLQCLQTISLFLLFFFSSFLSSSTSSFSFSLLSSRFQIAHPACVTSHSHSV